MKVWVNSSKPLNHRFKHIRVVFPTSPYQPFTPCEGDVRYLLYSLFILMYEKYFPMMRERCMNIFDK